MRVRIVQLGKGIFQYVTEGPATVEMGLKALGIDAAGFDVRVNGHEARLEQPLQDNDLVTVIPLIKGGVQGQPARVESKINGGGSRDA